MSGAATEPSGHGSDLSISDGAERESGAVAEARLRMLT